MIQRPGMYTGEILRDFGGDMQYYIWADNQWKLYYDYGTFGGAASAGSSYVGSYSNTQRQVFFTINTYTDKSNQPVSAKAYLNGVEIDGQSTTKGRVIFTLSEQQILNQSTITLISGDLKPINRFQVQARKNAFNDVNIVVFNDNEENTITPPVIPPADPSPTPPTGGGGGTSGGGGGGVIYNQSNNPYLEALNQQFAQEAQAPQL
jgi:hypothetical protein